jgi:hypothetical protein
MTWSRHGKANQMEGMGRGLPRAGEIDYNTDLDPQRHAARQIVNFLAGVIGQ